MGKNFKKGDLVQYCGQTYKVVVEHGEAKGLYYLHTMTGHFFGWVMEKHLTASLSPLEWMNNKIRNIK